MVVRFNIEYKTNWGEEVRVVVDDLETLLMRTDDGVHWTARLELDVPGNMVDLAYRYVITRDGAVAREEWNIPFGRCLLLEGGERKVCLAMDRWHDVPERACFANDAFRTTLFKHEEYPGPELSPKRGILLKVYIPDAREGYSVAVCGNQKALGDWDPAKAMPLNDTFYPVWEVELDASEMTFPLEYKFIVRDMYDDEKDVVWENGPNRHVDDPGLGDEWTYIPPDGPASFDIPAWRGAGVAIPVFALRSANSFGVGDFGDLRRLVDWAVSVKLKVIQILPVNDTTSTRSWTDSYPYNAISTYALHPMYLNIDDMKPAYDADDWHRVEKKRAALDAMPTIDYEAVNRLKAQCVDLVFDDKGEEVLASDDFQAFFDENSEWLMPYAAFCCLRDTYGTADFRQWPRHSTYDPESVKALCRPASPWAESIGRTYFVQYQLYTQLIAAREYAQANGIVLKGDLPIGISRDSVEAWMEPGLFNFDAQTGAPPDDFSVNGQNWGFPTYNWEAMARDDYRWWKKRLRHTARFFEAYRIDHILGFFRIWEIPGDAVHGLLGHFSPALPMSGEEIESYGLRMREEFLLPLIDDDYLASLFGDRADEVKREYLLPADPTGRYRMRPEMDTQRKVKLRFEGRDDDESRDLRDGLYALISDVLFIADTREPGKYHPRIGAMADHLFQTLGPDERQAFGRLHEDFFYHRHNDFWYQSAKPKLRAMKYNNEMLACGEDLGMIPACVPIAMREFEILSLEVQRMPKCMGQEFGRPAEYPYESVSTISTHDMSTLRGWWREDRAKTQRYYNDVLGYGDEAPREATPELCEEVLKLHLEGNSIFCIPSLQDWLSIDGKLRNPDVEAERVNVPANPRNYWKYRMHLTIGQLEGANELNRRIKELIKRSGRG
ncbi:MAG: 4-alpha-glucanotransferase [Mediterranea sp.]|jgi:4-alpha-glucanotransferase|nr:4-alpha-glucanotransferase [Mediterranea sp.]